LEDCFGVGLQQREKRELKRLQALTEGYVDLKGYPPFFACSSADNELEELLYVTQINTCCELEA
jgi:hypothetical protein